MNKSFQAILKNKSGAAFFMMAFIAIVVFIFLIVAIETIKVFSIKFDVETHLRRLANNVVETHINDTYRSDGLNVLATVGTDGPDGEDTMRAFLDNYAFYTMTTLDSVRPQQFIDQAKLPAQSYIRSSKFDSDSNTFLYMIDVNYLYVFPGDLQTGQEPYLECGGSIYIANSIPGLMNNFVFDIPFSIKSTNFRVDNSWGNTGSNLGFENTENGEGGT